MSAEVDPVQELRWVFTSEIHHLCFLGTQLWSWG